MNGQPQHPRPMVKWRVSLHCRQVRQHKRVTRFTEVVVVEAPENDLRAAAQAGMRQIHETHGNVEVMSIEEVTRIDLPEPPSTPAQTQQQPGLWDVTKEREV